jgi:hypothetical protein
MQKLLQAIALPKRLPFSELPVLPEAHETFDTPVTRQKLSAVELLPNPGWKLVGHGVEYLANLG